MDKKQLMKTIKNNIEEYESDSDNKIAWIDVRRNKPVGFSTVDKEQIKIIIKNKAW